VEQMSLREFVKESLVEIVQGVKEAQEETKETGALVNPRVLATGTAYTYIRGDGPHGGLVVTQMEFDVALKLAEGTGGKAAIGVVAGILGIGGEVKSEETTSHVSRLKFSVPVLLPPGPEDA